MVTKKTHRKYLDRQWEYKAISTMVENKKIVYGTLICKGKQSEGIEIYSGENYIVGSKLRSHSRTYKIDKTPPKYKSVVEQLKQIHSQTIWSKDNYVNEN